MRGAGVEHWSSAARSSPSACSPGWPASTTAGTCGARRARPSAVRWPGWGGGCCVGRAKRREAGWGRARAQVVGDHRRAPTAAPRIDGTGRRSAGARRGHRGIAGTRGCTASARRGVRRRGHVAVGADGAGPRDPAVLRGGRRAGRGVRRAAGRCPVLHQHPAAQLASAGGRHGADHVQSGCRGRIAGHPPGVLAAVAGRRPVLSVRRPGTAHRAGVGPDHHRGPCHPGTQADTDRVVPARRSGRWPAHPGAGHRSRGRIRCGPGRQPVHRSACQHRSGGADLRCRGSRDHPAGTGFRGAVRVRARPSTGLDAGGVRGCRLAAHEIWRRTVRVA